MLRIFFVLTCWASTVLARPVSFVGSTMGMAQVQPWAAIASIDHTFFRRVSVGVQYQWLNRTSGELNFSAPEVNVLLFRHNAEDWQANLFLTGAAGMSIEARHPFFAGYGALEADIESRRFLALASSRIFQSFSGQRDWQMLARVGFAPVVAEADQLNPWVMLQYQYMPSFATPHVVTPVVRLLYQGFLFEAGMSFRGDVFFNVAAEVP